MSNKKNAPVDNGEKPTEAVSAEASSEKVAADDNIVPLHEYSVKYDPQALRDFELFVFHVEHDADEYTAVQLSRTAPRGFCKTPEEVFVDRIARSEAPMQGYYSTATLGKTDGELRHNKAAFRSWRVFVADDVGTKIDPAKFVNAPPSYMIETSPGNFHVGYVWEDPIEDYEDAQAFINIMVDRGFTDGGGAMPCKKVRLPCGVNGKTGPNKFFPVQEVADRGPYWTPQALLDALGVDEEWEHYRAAWRTQAVRSKRLGTAAWIPDLFYVDPHTGIYDPILEWMYQQGRVIQDGSGSFMEVICPFHEEHSAHDLQSSLCGYSPLGQGLIPNRRVFHCFHDHCKHRSSEEFLQRLIGEGAPEMPAIEYAPRDTIKYVYDLVNDRVYDITVEGPLSAVRVEAVNRVTKPVPLPPKLGSNTIKFVPPLPLWLKQPSAVVTQGCVFMAGDSSRIVEDEHGQKRVNRFYMPTYPRRPPRMDRVQPFLDYLAYLIPGVAERDYFTRWLAMKIQKPAFRGAAMVMIAKSEGTGRNTLMKCISRLFGQHNVRAMTMDAMLSGSDFNEWATSLFVHVDESLATDTPVAARRAYNRLKELVDPMARDVVVNEKYGVKFHAQIATSYLFFSNHEDALYLNSGTRRFYVMHNTDHPAPPEYFTRFHQWLQSDWMGDVWNYFQDYEVSITEMMAPPPVTDAMKDMIHETTNPLEAVIDAAIAVWPSAAILPRTVMEVLPYYAERGLPEKYHPIARRMLADKLRSLRGRRGEVNFRFAGGEAKLKKQYAPMIEDTFRLNEERESCMRALEHFNQDLYRKHIDAWLEDVGFDF